MRPIIVMLFLLLTGYLATYGQELPPCRERPHLIEHPWVDATRFCLEEIILDQGAGELAFTALAASPDGTLYATRPLTGEVFALDDANGDDLPDAPYIVAEGLTRPNGLAYHDGALYISGGAYIYRLVDDTLDTLVDDLPSGSNGFWTGGIAIGPDERLYVATGAECDFCEPIDSQRGAILSFALDGTDRQVIATGLRQPSDLVFHNGTLWTTDTARDELFNTPDLDELNRVSPGVHFGFPFCVGSTNEPDLISSGFDCANADAPALTFPTHSAPTGLATYISGTFPSLTGALLVVLHGSYNQAELHGLALASVRFDGEGNPTSYEIVIPNRLDERNEPDIVWQDMQYSGAGFWPQRPLDVTVSAEGWVYISVSGGQILALRPR